MTLRKHLLVDVIDEKDSAIGSNLHGPTRGKAWGTALALVGKKWVSTFEVQVGGRRFGWTAGSPPTPSSASSSTSCLTSCVGNVAFARRPKSDDMVCSTWCWDNIVSISCQSGNLDREVEVSAPPSLEAGAPPPASTASLTCGPEVLHTSLDFKLNILWYDEADSTSSRSLKGEVRQKKFYRPKVFIQP